MNTNNNKTPLWLELKTQYIDDNFEKLLEYLKDNADKKKEDTFYTETIELLKERVENLIELLTSQQLFDDEIPREQNIFNAKILMAYILSDRKSELAKLAHVTLMYVLRELTPKYSELLIKTAMGILTHEEVLSVGFGWADVDKVSTELFANNVCNFIKYGKELQTPLIYTGKGTALLTGGGLQLMADKGKDILKKASAEADSLDTGIGIRLKVGSSDKLKKADENDLDKINSHVIEFLQKCQGSQPEQKKMVRRYYDDSKVVVRITNINYRGVVTVETTDENYEKITGTLHYNYSSFLYYYTDKLYQYFEVGDLMPATVVNAQEGKFCIEDQIKDFFIEEAKDYEQEDNLFRAVLIDDNPKYYGWMTEIGVPMFTGNIGGLVKGDFVRLSITSYGNGRQYGKIYAEFVDYEDAEFDEKEARRECMRAFATKTEPPAEGSAKANGATTATLNPAVLMLLIRFIYRHQKTVLKPSDKFRLLANATVMATIIDEPVTVSYLRFAATYLRALVRFACDEDISEISLQPDDEYKGATSTLIRLSVVQLLKEFGKKEDSSTLDNAISYFQEEIPLLAKIARLILAANMMQGSLSGSSLNVIKREIVKTLSLETENETDLEADGRTYLGVESGSQEFKTSIVYPPNSNMQPDEDTQTRNVMKGICAFLNSETGGTLYLGVNDMGYVTGVDNDMRYLKHGNLDSYMRYVQDRAIKCFGIDAIKYVTIEPMCDERVVAIRVKPHPYRIVELDGEAYIRINAESRLMPDNMKGEIIDQKMLRNKDKAAAISLLQHACTNKKKAVLHGYASSHGGVIADRNVEPYEICPEDDLAICYDLDKERCVVFNLNRINYVEVLDEGWTNTAKHEDIKVDVFHMTGEKAYPISLQLDLFARNLLVEEFPRAEKFLSADKKDNNVWYFNTEVHDMKGVGRFYIGLAAHIKILDAPELEKYVKDYCTEILKQTN